MFTYIQTNYYQSEHLLTILLLNFLRMDDTYHILLSKMLFKLIIQDLQEWVNHEFALIVSIPFSSIIHSDGFLPLMRSQYQLRHLGLVCLLHDDSSYQSLIFLHLTHKIYQVFGHDLKVSVLFFSFLQYFAFAFANSILMVCQKTML